MCDNCTGAGLSRRHLVFGAAALVAAGPLISTFPAYAEDAGVPPGEALKRLQEGNARYVSSTSINRDYSVGRAERAQSQAPFASIVGCADSRVAPEIVFDQGPGDLFVVRVAGNFINDDGLGSLEFGSTILGSKLIMVLGHSGCGAIRGAIDVVQNGAELPGHIALLADSLKPAVEAAIAEKPADLLEAATVENVRLNVAYLKTATPIIADLVAKGELEIVGGIYDLTTGKVAMI